MAYILLTQWPRSIALFLLPTIAYPCMVLCNCRCKYLFFLFFVSLYNEKKKLQLLAVVMFGLDGSCDVLNADQTTFMFTRSLS